MKTSTSATLGISYRRLDYWARCGYLRPENNGRGSGAWRVWPERELAVAQLMARLIDAGLSLASAAGASRALVDAAPVQLNLGCGYGEHEHEHDDDEKSHGDDHLRPTSPTAHARPNSRTARPSDSSQITTTAYELAPGVYLAVGDGS